jgi:glycine hydroxymethyltransferase
MEEHLAVRQAAGLFDVAHMGVYQAEGPDAGVFLDSVVGNDISGLGVGESLYTHFLTPQAEVIDDLLVYRRGLEKFLVVVNASNDDKDWAWLNAVKDGQVQVDLERPWARAFGRNVILRNLRDPKEGADMRVDIALQGPRSRDILLSLGCDEETSRGSRLSSAPSCARRWWAASTWSCPAPAIPASAWLSSCSSTPTSRRAFQCPAAGRGALRDQALRPGGARLFAHGGRPAVYGHEMGGEHSLGVGEGGFGAYVKTYKPWFIGRQAFLERRQGRKSEVVRFRFTEKGVRMAHSSDPVMDKRGRVIGWVTSCAVDSEGYLTGQAYYRFEKLAEGRPDFHLSKRSQRGR